MRFLFDYFPIICFFIAYKFWGIYVSTAAAMAVSVFQIGAYWIRFCRFEKFHVITLIFILLLGGCTLIFHQAIFIEWKPSIVYWIFSIILLSSHFFGKHTLIRQIFKEKIELPIKTWSRLNLSWGLFFLILGILNLIVAYHFDINTWINFKLFGISGLVLIFILGQVFYIARHVPANLKIESR